VSAIATETTEAVIEALIGRVGRDEAAAAVAAVSAGKR
jgi:F-type H+-transporting ATPase subunit b